MWGFLRRLWGKPRKDIYGLDHAVLNMQLPPRSMWMNVGYWEVSDAFTRKKFTSLEANLLLVYSRLSGGLPGPARPGVDRRSLDRPERVDQSARCWVWLR